MVECCSFLPWHPYKVLYQMCHILRAYCALRALLPLRHGCHPRHHLIHQQCLCRCQLMQQLYLLRCQLMHQQCRQVKSCFVKSACPMSCYHVYAVFSLLLCLFLIKKLQGHIWGHKYQATCHLLGNYFDCQS